jgi:2'-5' RNA ligase
VLHARSGTIRQLGLTRPASALAVPVPAAAEIIPLPRITVLFPFVAPRRIDPRLQAAIRQIASQAAPFEFALARVDRFPGVLYLAPEPSEPFKRLTAQCTARWPEVPPYGGAYDEVVPHLTVAEGAEPPGLAEQLERRLPLRTEATHLALLVRERRSRWSIRARFPLGA